MPVFDRTVLSTVEFPCNFGIRSEAKRLQLFDYRQHFQGIGTTRELCLRDDSKMGAEALRCGEGFAATFGPNTKIAVKIRGARLALGYALTTLVEPTTEAQAERVARQGTRIRGAGARFARLS